jgi:hypothetical protein
MRMRYEFLLLIVLTMTTSTGAVAQKLTEDHVAPRRRLALLRWNDLSPNGIVDELGDGMDAKLEHNLCPVRFDRPDRDS